MVTVDVPKVVGVPVISELAPIYDRPFGKPVTEIPRLS